MAIIRCRHHHQINRRGIGKERIGGGEDSRRGIIMLCPRLALGVSGDDHRNLHPGDGGNQWRVEDGPSKPIAQDRGPNRRLLLL